MKIKAPQLHRFSHRVLPAVPLLLLLLLTGCNLQDAASETPPASIYELAVTHQSRSRADRQADQYRRPLEVLSLSGARPGMVVVDLLGGSGYYAELFNSLVGPDGTVYLQNNSLFLRFSTDSLVDRLAGGRLKNVVRLDSEFADFRLPSDVDLVFMGLSYHDVYVPRDDPTIMTTPEAFFPQIVASLKPGGRLLIIDHAAEPGTGISTTPELHRIDREFAIEAITDAGFELVGSSDALRNPRDDYSLDIWNQEVFHKTDRFVLLFEKK